MSSNLYLLWISVVVLQPASCFYHLCNSPKNTILSEEECSDLYFEPSEKSTALGHVKLEFEQNSLKVTPKASAWTTTYLKISTPQNSSNQFCSKLLKEETTNFYCFTFTPEVENETFQLEYKVENLPDICFKRFIFSLPDWQGAPLFLYVDQTDTSRLILQAEKLPTLFNISYYKVEAYKEKNGNTNLQDLKLFPSTDEIYYELFTYNDVGNYYFAVSIISDNCTEECLKTFTPKIFIGRKSTRVVIGIVGASFILPFVLFIFHILTKKYPEENNSKSRNKLLVAYKSSTKKHNEVVQTLAAFLEQLLKNQKIDIVDLSKNTKKSCSDSLLLADCIVYIAPPKHDLNPIPISKSLSEQKFIGVMFDHCVDKLPRFFDSNKTFKLFEDIDTFLHALNISGSYDTALYQDLIRKTEEAKTETDHFLNSDAIPKIIVTESEPQEHDSLITEKFVL